ncbi:hypothetical protein Tco_1537679, partial [Tanacetum coccineum]
AYTDSDYAGATQDRKSTTRGCQFLGKRLISWQCKKQIVVATSTTEAEYVAATSCCGQVLWIQNRLLDYGLTSAESKASRHVKRGRDTKIPQSSGPPKRLVMRLSIRSWVTKWKGLPLLLLAKKQSMTVVTSTKTQSMATLNELTP